MQTAKQTWAACSKGSSSDEYYSFQQTPPMMQRMHDGGLMGANKGRGTVDGPKGRTGAGLTLLLVCDQKKKQIVHISDLKSTHRGNSEMDTLIAVKPCLIIIIETFRGATECL
eukprot:3039677-Amphidinium_carterae.1